MYKNNDYLTTGEFAKLCNTSKHTLFHYFDIGLFLPKYIDENGYRYYHILQYDMFNTIKQLGVLGMSLSEIKEYFIERSPKKMIELYTKQENFLDNQIEALKLMKNSIHELKKNMEHALLHSNKFFIEILQAQYLQYSDILKDADDNKMTYEFGKLLRTSQNKICPYILGMFHDIKDIKNNNFRFRFYIQTTSLRSKNSFIRPHGEYLSMFHFGRYEELYQSYSQIISYAEDNAIELYKNLYSETIIGDWAVTSSEEYVIKISVQIKKNHSKNA